MSYKLVGAKENETPEATIIRCANNLIKAVMAAGYSLHSTSGMSGLEIGFYSHCPNEVEVYNVLSHWKIKGRCPIKISFKPTEESLALDE